MCVWAEVPDDTSRFAMASAPTTAAAPSTPYVLRRISLLSSSDEIKAAGENRAAAPGACLATGWDRSVDRAAMYRCRPAYIFPSIELSTGNRRRHDRAAPEGGPVRYSMPRATTE